MAPTVEVESLRPELVFDLLFFFSVFSVPLCPLCKNAAGELARMHPFAPVRRPPFDTEGTEGTEGTEAQRTQRKRESGSGASRQRSHCIGLPRRREREQVLLPRRLLALRSIESESATARRVFPWQGVAWPNSSCCRCRLTWLPMPDDLHPEARATRRGYFARRWHGDVPAAVLLWRDMLALGTLANLAVTFAALFMLSQGAHPAVAAAVHFSPAPYNAFLVAAFWRSAQRTTVTGAIAVAWLCLVTLI
jgi:hypothetical protein